MAFSSAFSSVFVKASERYILPMRAQEALFSGAAYEYAGGVLRVGGRVLIGLSGEPYAFRSADTARTWCEAGKRVIQAEMQTVDRLSESVRAAWVARKVEKLAARAESIIARAAKQEDAAKRAALLDEAAWCQSKWAS